MRAHKFQISTEGVYIYTEGMYKICMEGVFICMESVNISTELAYIYLHLRKHSAFIQKSSVIKESDFNFTERMCFSTEHACP